MAEVRRDRPRSRAARSAELRDVADLDAAEQAGPEAPGADTEDTVAVVQPEPSPVAAEIAPSLPTTLPPDFESLPPDVQAAIMAGIPEAAPLPVATPTTAPAPSPAPAPAAPAPPSGQPTPEFVVPSNFALDSADLAYLQATNPTVAASVRDEGVTLAFRKHGDVLINTRFERELQATNPELLRVFREQGAAAFETAAAIIIAEEQAATARVGVEQEESARLEAEQQAIAGVVRVTTATDERGVEQPMISFSVELEPAARPVTGIKAVWRFLTPWTESADETFLSHMSGWPQRVKDDWVASFRPQEPKSQSALAEQFQAEQDAPLWARLLMGNTIVQRSDGTFSPVVVGVVDLPVGPGVAARTGDAARRVLEIVKRGVKTLGPDDVRMNPAQFDRFIKARVVSPNLAPEVFKAGEVARETVRRNINVNWAKMAEEIARGNVKNADDAAKWAARNARPAPVPAGAGASPAQLAAEAVRKGSTQTDIERIIKAFNDSVKAKQLVAASSRPAILPVINPYIVPDAGAASTWQPFKPGTLTEERIKELVDQWTTLRPAEAVRRMTGSNLTNVAAVAAPASVIQIAQKATPVTREKLLAALSPAAQQAIATNNATSLQNAAANEVMLSNVTATALKNATASAVEASTRVSVATGTGVRTTPATTLATTVVTPSAVSLVTAKPTITPTPVPIPAPTLLPTPTTVPVETRIRAVSPLPPFSGDDDGAAITGRISPGAIAWKMGLFWKWIPPEDFQDGVKPRTLPLGIAPMGADTTGGNSPSATIQVIGESSAPVPARIAVDLGIVDAHILNGNRIEFTGGGLRTDVGQRDASTTTGMSVNGGTDAFDDFPDEEQGRARPATIRRKPKRRKRRPESDISDLTSLRGFRP